MLQPSFSKRHLRSPATWLALVLVLFATGVQAAELSHLHNGLDPAEHCLLCKADSTHWAPNGSATDAAALTAVAPTQGQPGPTLAPTPRTANARGPPAHF